MGKFWLSLVALAILAVGAKAQYANASKELANASPADVAQVKRAVGSVEANPVVKEQLQAFENANTDNREQEFQSLTAVVNRLAKSETATGQVSAGNQIQSIKAHGFYRDSGIKQSSSWLGDALSRLKNFRFKMPQAESGPGPSLGGGNFLVYAAWGVVGAVVALLLYLGFRHINWQNALRRKAKSMIEDDEPERTLDEWLSLADDHAAAGRYREAVRALYLACLLRFDETRIARFDRGQTNWEHLFRIENSPKLPMGLNFRATTMAFDRIWYGRANTSMADVDRFREWYMNIKAATEAKAA